jgi:hypothetical protein
MSFGITQVGRDGSNSAWISATTALVATSAVSFSLGYLVGRNEWRICDSFHRLTAGLFSSEDNQATIPASLVLGSEDIPTLHIIILDEVVQHPSTLVEVASRTVLGQFKKLYKHRNPILNAWENNKKPLRVYITDKETVLSDIQAAARSEMIPTHTFVTMGASNEKNRKAIAVGPVARHCDFTSQVQMLSYSM